jgi:hypothetical protein
MLAMTVLLECQVERKNSIALPVKQKFVYPRCCGLGDAIRDAWTILGTRRVREDHEQTGQEQKMKKCAADAFLLDVGFGVHGDPFVLAFIPGFSCNGKRNGTTAAKAMFLIRWVLAKWDLPQFVAGRARRVPADTTRSKNVKTRQVLRLRRAGVTLSARLT